MGYLAYEAAGLLDGHPAPHADEAPCPPVGLLAIDARWCSITGGSGWSWSPTPRRWLRRRRAALEDLAGRSRRPRRCRCRRERLGARTGEPNMADERYREIVSTFKEHILAGDIFQGVPSRRVSFPAPDGRSPSTGGSGSRTPRRTCSSCGAGLELAGSSPEPLVRVEGRRVSTRPIAGPAPGAPRR